MHKFIAIFVFFILIVNTHAEYRVYQYSVRPQSDIRPKEAQAEAQLVTTTLNPVSFVAFNGGHSLTKVSLLKTWKCVGYTGESKPLCASPSDKLEQQLANQLVNEEGQNEN